MADWMNYSKIQEHKRKGFKKSQVAQKIGLTEKFFLGTKIPPNHFTDWWYYISDINFIASSSVISSTLNSISELPIEPPS